MRNVGGVFFWPNPILHLAPHFASNCIGFITIQSCGFCNRSYHCHDIVVTSCKHTFHPFCLREFLKGTNKCIICGQTLHLDWCNSWGFRETNEKMANLAIKLDLDAQWEWMKESLKQAISYHPIIFSECFYSCLTLYYARLGSSTTP